MKYICACCGYRTLEEDPCHPTFEICNVCFWEHDPVQEDKPDFSGGANALSLNQSKANFAQFGACEERFIKHVRKPHKDEQA